MESQPVRKPSLFDDTPEETHGYASPPCYQHEIDPEYGGRLNEVAPLQPRDTSVE
jgi:hypothetical protein